MNEEYITHSFEDTQKLGEEFATRLNLDQGSTLTHLTQARIIALYGDLGSGKTTFVQGLAKGLGIQQRIISPTFVIIRQYVIPNLFRDLKTLSSRAQRGDLKKNASSQTPRNDVFHFYHIDLYRTESEKDLEGLGIEEMMKDKNAIVVIEWAEKMGNLLPEKRIDIRFEYFDEDKRKIVISQME